MNPVHIVTNKDNISELVLMPGDPLRAKYIAENFLENSILVNDVRNMLGYTGYYKGVKITVIASGMGIPSMGIYSYELAHFYNVKKIIRIGSAGALNASVHIRDLVVATEAKSLSTFAISYANEEVNTAYISENLLNAIKKEASSSINVHFGPILTSDTFDVYTGINHVLERLGFDNPLASEMETFALYYIGKKENIETASILTVVDSKYESNLNLTSEERETSLNDMIKLALEAIIK